MNTTFLLRASLVAPVAMALAACGGGGSSSSGSSIVTIPTGTTPTAPSGTSAPTSVVVSTIRIQPSDVLATTTYAPSLTYHISDYLNSRFAALHNLIIPAAYAQSAPLVKISNQQNISKRLVSGNLIPIAVTYATPPAGNTAKCDLSSAEILVNKIWITNEKTNDVIANLSVLSSVDANCNGSYSTSDYVISGVSGKVFKIDQNITGSISDVIAANDPAFNASSNGLLVMSNGQVQELDVQADKVTITQLTTDSIKLMVRTGVNAIAYDGTYLVGVSDSPGSPIIVYKKGEVAFKIFRPNTENSYPGIFINPEGNFVWNDVLTMHVLDPVTLSISPYRPYTQPTSAPGTTPIGFQGPPNMYGARGRFGKWVMGDRCIIWNTANGDWINLNFYPKFAKIGFPPNQRLDYSRISGKYAYCVDGTYSGYVRFDLEKGEGVGVDLTQKGFIASGYEIFQDVALARITNSANSNVEYIQINLSDGAVTRLGVITAGTRRVISLVQIG